MKRVCLYLIITCLLVSCSSTKIQSWMDSSFEGRTLGKTMVLGVAESDSMSRQYEALFTEALSGKGIEAASLHALLQRTDKITEEELAAVLKKHNYRSILVTRKLSEAERQQVVTTGSYPSHYGGYYGYYSHAFSSSYNTVAVQSFLEFELETNLYDVETRKLVWSGRMVVYDNSSDLTNMKKIIRAVVRDLGKKGLLQAR